MRSMEISEARASEQEEEFGARLTEMSKRYQESEDKALKYEEHATELESTLSELEVKLAEEKDTYQRVKTDLDNLLVEIQGLDD